MIGPFGLGPKGTMRMRALPMAQALTARGHEVEMFLAPWSNPEDSGREEERGGVEIRNITLPASIPLLRHLIITWRLLSQALRSRPDIVHCFKSKAYSGLVAMAIWFLRKVGLASVGLVMDSDDWEGTGGWNEIENYTWLQKRFFAFQEKWGLLHCDAVTVASRALQTLAWSLGVKPGNVFYVPNGLRVEGPFELSLPKGSPTVLLYTRFFEFTLERMVEIWQRVVEVVPEAQLLVVGKGLFGEESEFLRLMDERRLAKGVEYLGWLEGERLKEALHSADVAIYLYDDTLVNRTKCSVKLIELMATGLPIVADDVGQNREYIEHGISGWLVAPGDDRAFSEAAVELLRDEERRWELGRRAQERVRGRFDWAILVRMVEEAYDMALRGA